MFSSSYFTPEYFNEYFKVTGEVIELPSGGFGVNVNKRGPSQFHLNREDEDILEFVIAFVLSGRI